MDIIMDIIYMEIIIIYMDTDSFIIDVETDDFYKDISNDVEKWFDTSGYDKRLNRPLETGLNKKVLGKFKDEMDGNIITKFVPCVLKYMLLIMKNITLKTVITK